MTHLHRLLQNNVLVYKPIQEYLREQRRECKSLRYELRKSQKSNKILENKNKQLEEENKKQAEQISQQELQNTLNYNQEIEKTAEQMALTAIINARQKLLEEELNASFHSENKPLDHEEDKYLEKLNSERKILITVEEGSYSHGGADHGDANLALHVSNKIDEVLNLTDEEEEEDKRSFFVQQLTEEVTIDLAKDSAPKLQEICFRESCFKEELYGNSKQQVALAALREEENSINMKKFREFRFLESLLLEIKGHETSMKKKPFFTKKSKIHKRFVNNICQKIWEYIPVFTMEENQTN